MIVKLGIMETKRASSYFHSSFFGSVRKMLMIAQQCKEIFPVGLKPPTGANNKGKSYCETTMRPGNSFLLL